MVSQRQPGLRAFEDQQLEQRAVVVHRHAPLGVVVGDVERVVAAPGAALKGAGAGILFSPHCSVKQKVAPWPGALSAQMRPPWRLDDALHGGQADAGAGELAPAGAGAGRA